MQTQLPANQHASVSMLISEIERILCAGVLPQKDAQRLRVKTLAACGDCGIKPPIADQDNGPEAAEYERQLGAVSQAMNAGRIA